MRGVAALVMAAALLAGCGAAADNSSLTSAASPSNTSAAPATASGNYTDPYGYKCTMQEAEPYGLCPDDHNARTADVTITDSTGARCNFSAYDTTTGRCPATDNHGNQCPPAQLNASTDTCNDPTVTDSEGNQCFKSQAGSSDLCLPGNVNSSTYTDAHGKKCAPSRAVAYDCPTGASSAPLNSTPPPEVICATDANTGQPSSIGCFWAEPMPLPAKPPYNSNPAGPPSGYDSQLGCTWHNNGNKGANQAGPGSYDFTCS